MPLQIQKTDSAAIKVPVSCIADFVGSPGRSAVALIRPYKFNTRGEGAARSGYYRFAVNAIRSYHTHSRDPKVFQLALHELHKRARDSKEKGSRVKFEKNITAIELYSRLYKDRNFTVVKNHRIAYRIGQVRISAQPDIWVEENGTQLLLKIGIAKKMPSYVDMLLTIIRKAAISSGYKQVRARNIIYLNVSSGRELTSRGGLVRFNRTFQVIAADIARVWPKVTQNSVSV